MLLFSLLNFLYIFKHIRVSIKYVGGRRFKAVSNVLLPRAEHGAKK